MTTEGVLYFMLNALESRQLHKMYNFIFKCPEPKQKLYCFIFIWPLAKRTIQSCYDSSAMPPREPFGPLLGFHSINFFLTKFKIYGLFLSQ